MGHQLPANLGHSNQLHCSINRRAPHHLASGNTSLTESFPCFKPSSALPGPQNKVQRPCMTQPLIPSPTSPDARPSSASCTQRRCLLAPRPTNSLCYPHRSIPSLLQKLPRKAVPTSHVRRGIYSLTACSPSTTSEIN